MKYLRYANLVFTIVLFWASALYYTKNDIDMTYTLALCGVANAGLGYILLAGEK